MNPKYYLFTGRKGELIRQKGLTEFPTIHEALAAFEAQDTHTYGAILQFQGEVKLGAQITGQIQLRKDQL